MVRKHEIRIGPRNSLDERIKRLFGYDGTPIKINGRDYTLRERGDLKEDDPIRLAILSQTKRRLFDSPHSIFTNRTKISLVF